MNRSESERGSRTFPLIIVMLVITLFLFLIVFELISRNAFLPVFVAAIAVVVFVAMVGAFVMRFVMLPWWELRYEHAARVMEHERQVLKIELTESSVAALPEPEGGGGLVNSQVEQFRGLALQLIGVTYNRMGRQSKQLIPFNTCATEKIDPFDDVDKWLNAETYLLNNNLVAKKMVGKKCVGVYCTNERTVADVYRDMMGG